ETRVAAHGAAGARPSLAGSAHRTGSGIGARGAVGRPRLTARRAAVAVARVARIEPAVAALGAHLEAPGVEDAGAPRRRVVDPQRPGARGLLSREDGERVARLVRLAVGRRTR